MSRKSSTKSLPLEKETQKLIANFMRSSGFTVQTNVKTPLGYIDILVREYLPNGGIFYHVIEVKRDNGSNSIKHAIGQLREYRKHYGSNTKLYFCTGDDSPLSAEAKRVMQSNPDILYKVFK